MTRRAALKRGVVDVHCHLAPLAFPANPSPGTNRRWPCMACQAAGEATLMIGETPFRKLDDRSWAAARRIEDMDRDGVTTQVLSPMPELLSYWFDTAEAELLCDHVNGAIAGMIAEAPGRFRGLGMVPLQDPAAAVRGLERLKTQFGLSGVEIGSNINGALLGDARFDPFYEAAQALDLAIFVHALHPIATAKIEVGPAFTAFAGFPIDVAMAGASLILSGTLERFPRLRIGLSHGGGTLGAMLGRLDKGWEKTGGYGGRLLMRPSTQARTLFYDSNVYEPAYLEYLVSKVAPGQVFLGTDYPYEIMQTAPTAFLDGLALNKPAQNSLRWLAAAKFLGADIEG